MVLLSLLCSHRMSGRAGRRAAAALALCAWIASQTVALQAQDATRISIVVRLLVVCAASDVLAEVLQAEFADLRQSRSWMQTTYRLHSAFVAGIKPLLSRLDAICVGQGWAIPGDVEPLFDEDVSGIGVTATGWNTQFYILRMTWVKLDSVWYGQWRWVQYDRAAWEDVHYRGRPPLDETPLERAIQRGRAAERDIPQEVLLLVVQTLGGAAAREASGQDGWFEHICVPPLRSAGYVDGKVVLQGLAMSCRAWYDLCAPLLFAAISVDVDTMDAFRACVKAPGSCIARYAGVACLRGEHPWAAYPKLLTVLPRIVNLEFHQPRAVDNIAKAYPPSLPLSISLRCPASCGVRTILFRGCHFTSSVDLLQILAAFPCLEAVFLVELSLKTLSIRAGSTPRRRSQLCSIRVVRYKDFWPLAFSWIWPHPATDKHAPDFPGLSYGETRIAISIIQCFAISEPQLRVDISGTHGSRCCTLISTTIRLFSYKHTFRGSVGVQSDRSHRIPRVGVRIS